jgi:hypothetical protein
VPDITGRVLEQGGSPQAGLRVELWQFNSEYGLTLLDVQSTDTGGHFTVGMPAFGLFLQGLTPSGEFTLQGLQIRIRSEKFTLQGLQIRIRSEIGRVVWKAETLFLNPFGSGKPFGDITILTNNLRGWRITNLNATGDQPMFSTKNFVTPLIDATEAWTAIENAVNASTTEINLQLFYVRCVESRSILPLIHPATDRWQRCGRPDLTGRSRLE